MCITSAILDNLNNHPNYLGTIVSRTVSPIATKEDIDSIRSEVLELKELLKAAIRYDTVTGKPNCEMEEKKKVLLNIADLLNVDMSDIFSKKEK